MKANRQYYWDILSLKNVSCCQTQCSRNYSIFRKTVHYCIVEYSPTAVAKKVLISLLLSYAPPPQKNQMLNPIDYKISRFILQHEHKFRVNKTEKKQTAINRSLGKQ